MRISDKKLQCLRKHFANEVVFYCGALGVTPADFEFRLEVAKGVLTVSALCDELLHWEERIKVGSMQPRFLEHLLASFRVQVEEAFKRTLEPLAEAA